MNCYMSYLKEFTTRVFVNLPLYVVDFTLFIYLFINLFMHFFVKDERRSSYSVSFIILDIILLYELKKSFLWTINEAVSLDL